MKIHAALKKNEKDLLNKKNVIAVGIGQKWSKGKNTGKEALLVFVSSKEEETDLKPSDLIPKSLDNHTTDVVGRTGTLKALALTDKVRPFKAGYSCGHTKVTAGTLGAWFKDKDDELVGLSNNHVLANENRTNRKAWIVQPGVYDDPNWRPNFAGRLKNHVKLRRGYNTQDSAIFKPELPVDTILENIGAVKGWNDNPQVGDSVQKLGRTTGYTIGKIIAIGATVQVQYDRGVYTFRDQIITDYMSQGGDSGSLLCDMGGNATGLLFAGSNTVTIHNKIKYPRNAYGLKIYQPLEETLTHTVTVDGVDTVLALNGADDFKQLLSELRNLATQGKAVNLTLNYQVNKE
jgi:hypothetical protein